MAHFNMKNAERQNLGEMATNIIAQMSDDDREGFLEDPEGWREGFGELVAYSDPPFDQLDVDDLLAEVEQMLG